jgi:hypothetical protein
LTTIESPLEARLRGIEDRLLRIESTMTTKDDLSRVETRLVTLLLTLILPMYAVLIVFLIFVYNAKP